jgi:hypothetical protein
MCENKYHKLLMQVDHCLALIDIVFGKLSEISDIAIELNKQNEEIENNDNK